MLKFVYRGLIASKKRIEDVIIRHVDDVLIPYQEQPPAQIKFVKREVIKISSSRSTSVSEAEIHILGPTRQRTVALGEIRGWLGS